jgi:hypothetical protein
MHSLKQVLIYGFLLWLIPFVVAIAVFPFRESNVLLFESVMVVTVSATAAWLAALYIGRQRTVSLFEAVMVGVIWTVINLSFDYVFFIRGPGKMQLMEYIYDIGITHVLYILLVPAVAYAANKRQQKVTNETVL